MHARPDTAAAKRKALEPVLPERSGRKRKARDRYQDPHFRSLMTDNNKDVLSSESEPEEEEDDEEFSPLQGGEYSLDEASSSDDASSEDE